MRESGEAKIEAESALLYSTKISPKLSLLLTGGSKVDQSTPDQHGQVVKEAQAILSRRMDRRDDGGVVQRQLGDKPHDLHKERASDKGRQTRCCHVRASHLICCVAVEPGRRLVKEKNAGVGDEGDADVSAFGLAAGDALDQVAADDDVLALLQRQLLQDVVHSGLLGRLALAHGALQFRSVHEHLLDGQHSDERVKLLYVAGVLAETRQRIMTMTDQY